ncbi:MAG: hypothetical protein AAF961_01310 [Planctomycetota bacterium]
MRREFDEDDVASNAFHSLGTGVEQRRFRRLEDRDDLWSSLPVARLKIEAYSGKGAAERLQCSLRTVGRRLGLIRSTWDPRS